MQIPGQQMLFSVLERMPRQHEHYLLTTLQIHDRDKDKCRKERRDASAVNCELWGQLAIQRCYADRPLRCVSDFLEVFCTAASLGAAFARDAFFAIVLITSRYSSLLGGWFLEPPKSPRKNFAYSYPCSCVSIRGSIPSCSPLPPTHLPFAPSRASREYTFPASLRHISNGESPRGALVRRSL